MKKRVAILALVLLIFSCCGCSAQRDADEFSKKIETLCDKSSPDYNEEDIVELYNDYKNLDSNIQGRIENIDTLKNETAAIMTSKMVTAKNGDSDQVKEWLVDYKDILSDEQMTDCLKQYGRWGALEQAESEIQSLLKSPRSYYRYDGSISAPVEEDGIYKVTVKLQYGATNSFGAEVTDNATVNVWYIIDTDNAEVTYIKVELSAYDAWRMS